MFWKKKKKADIGKKQNDFALNMQDQPDLKVVIKTDLGNVRTNNEDAASFFRMKDETIIREKGHLIVLADGMGGHQAGEVASKMALEIISQEYFKQTREKNIEKILARAFNTANKKIFDLASENEKYHGMGTTCTAIVILSGAIYFAHAGDSRAYLYKNKSIARLTEDHTYVHELVRSGGISAEEAEKHPQRNILINAMGTKPSLRVDTGKCLDTFDRHDRLLLCSDGLYDYINDDELAKILDYKLLEEAADYLIDETKRRGAYDNITVALAEMTDTAKDINLKLTRDIDLPVLTRETDLPTGINTSEYDR